MISLDDLQMALEFVSSGEMSGSSAYIDRESGDIYFVSDFSDAEYPDDIDENDRYLPVPHKRELGLGKSLALRFAEQHISDDVANVHHIFSSKGAFSKFKDLLEAKNILSTWYDFEQDETRKALINWCHDVDIKTSI